MRQASACDGADPESAVLLRTGRDAGAAYGAAAGPEAKRAVRVQAHAHAAWRRTRGMSPAREPAIAMALGAALVVLWTREEPALRRSEFHGALRLLRAVALLYLVSAGLVAQVVVWRRTGIDFERIFQLAPGTVPRNARLAQLVAWSLAMYFAAFAAFLVLEDLHLFAAAGAVTVALFVVQIVALATLAFKAQATLVGVGLASFGLAERSFLANFAADYATSLTRMFGDVAHAVCDIVHADGLAALAKGNELCTHNVELDKVVVPILTCWPFWARFGQCICTFWRTEDLVDAANALKYALAHAVVLVPATSRPGWIWAIAVVNSGLFFIWDVKMDWGLQWTGWRAERHFSPWLYQIATALDFGLRVVWTLSIAQFEVSDRVLELFAFAEVIRRMAWGLLRVEHEHVKLLLEKLPAGPSWDKGSIGTNAVENGGDQGDDDDVDEENGNRSTVQLAAFSVTLAAVLISLITLGLST